MFGWLARQTVPLSALFCFLRFHFGRLNSGKESSPGENLIGVSLAVSLPNPGKEILSTTPI